MAKTYIPSAVDKTTDLHKYLSRYQPKLTPPATPEQLTALNNLVTKCAEFLAVWHKPPPNP